MKENVENEKIKRDFLKWLREADGCSQSTVKNVEQAIYQYQVYTKGIDFRLFNPDRAIEFKESLKKREFNGKTISLTTYHLNLRLLRKFFKWLSGQPSYKSKITPDQVDYLKTSAKEERMATRSSRREFPDLEYVKRLAGSIVVNNEVDLRDRALISFTLLSGMRDDAIVSLRVGHFIEKELIVDQNPVTGVRTKFSKKILTVLFKFDDLLLEHFLIWHKHLIEKGFGPQDPLFPKSKLNQGCEIISFQASAEIEPEFWNGAGQMRQIFRSRAGSADLPYFPPHSFRHLAVDIALRYCHGGRQLKAVSQNFGHEFVATTLSAYANLEDEQLVTEIGGMRFSGEPRVNENEKLRKIREILID